MSRKQSRLDKPSAQLGAKLKRKSDVLLIQGVSESGDAMAVVRARDDRLETGIVRPVKEACPCLSAMPL